LCDHDRNFTMAERSNVFASRSVVVTETGAPPEFLEVEWADLQGDEVLVEIAATGICHTDLSAASGVLPAPTPIVLGHEAAGVIAAVGPSAESARVGDRVVVSVSHHCGHCRFCEEGRTALCIKRGAHRARLTSNGRVVVQGFGTGTFGQHIVVRERSVVSVPEEVPFDVAAVAGCAAVTGLGASINDADIRPGDSVVVFGCGGVGLCAVMGARLAGAERIVAVDLSEQRRSCAIDAGATEAVSQVTDAFDVVLECTGNAAVMPIALEAAGPMGRIVLVGLPSGDVTMSIPVTRFANLTQRLIGCNMGGLRPHIDFPRYFNLYRQGRLPLDLLTGTSMPFAEAANGFEMARQGAALRVMLVP